MNRRSFLKLFGPLLASIPFLSSFKALWAPTSPPAIPPGHKLLDWQEVTYDAFNQIGVASGKAIAARNEMSHMHDMFSYAMMMDGRPSLFKEPGKSIFCGKGKDKPIILWPTETITQAEFKRRYPKRGAIKWT